MFKKWYRLRVGLMTLATLGVMFAICFDEADAAKPGPTQPVTYAMETPLSLAGFPVRARCTVQGMNNLGDVFAILGADEGIRVVIWRSATNAFDDVHELIMADPYLVKHVSPELEAALDGKQWSDVVNLWFDEYGHRINDAGQITGSFLFITDLTEKMHAFRYTPAQSGQAAEFIDLPVPPGYAGCNALGINNDGDVVGSADGDAFLWKNIRIGTDGHPVADMMLCDAGVANDVNDADNEGHVQVAGTTNLGGSGGRGADAFRFDTATGQSTLLGVLRQTPPEGSGAVAINNVGQVAGGSIATSTGNVHAVRYTDRVMVDLGTLGSSALSSSGWDINDNGDVVGWADVSTKARSVFLYTDAKKMLNLAKLIDTATLPTGAATSNIIIASKINDNYHLLSGAASNYSQISGTISVNGMVVPFILTPTQEQ